MSDLASSPEPLSATPVRGWHAALLSGLFVLAPAPVLSALAAIVGRSGGMEMSAARAWVMEQPLALALASALSVVAPLWLVRQPLPRAPWKQALGLARSTPRVIATALITGVALQLPLSEAANLMELVWPESLEQKQAIAKLLAIESPLDALQVIVAVVIAAPLCEELLFRGVLLRGMTRVHSAALSLGLSALLFGVAHAARLTSVLPATLAGLVLGALTLRHRSIVPSIALHAAVNATPLLLPSSLVTIPGFNTLQEGVYHVPPLWLVPSCVVALGGLWWLLGSETR